MIRSWNLTNKIKSKYPNIKVIEFDTIEDILEAIKLNFIEATVLNELSAKYYINQNRYENHLKTIGGVTIDGFYKELYMGVEKIYPCLKLFTIKP